MEKEQNRKLLQKKQKFTQLVWFSDVIILHIGLWTNKIMSLTEFHSMYSNVVFSTILMPGFHAFEFLNADHLICTEKKTSLDLMDERILWNFSRI